MLLNNKTFLNILLARLNRINFLQIMFFCFVLVLFFPENLSVDTQWKIKQNQNIYTRLDSKLRKAIQSFSYEYYRCA